MGHIQGAYTPLGFDFWGMCPNTRVKLLCLSKIALSLDRRTIYQKVENKSIGDRNITQSAVRCSGMKQVLHVGTSAAAVLLSSASQE